MIRENEITSVGSFLKPHGIKGEIAAELDIDCEEVDNLTCIICEMEGIFVPFFINNARSKGRDTVLLTVDGVKDEKEAAMFTGKTIYALSSEVEQEGISEGMYVTDLAGFTVIEEETGTVGIIDYVDDSTANILFVVKDKDGETIYIPAAEEFITGLDPDDKTITMRLPDGLL